MPSLHLSLDRQTYKILDDEAEDLEISLQQHIRNIIIRYQRLMEEDKNYAKIPIADWEEMKKLEGKG